MVLSLKIEKNGDIKNINIDNTNELYKKCGFKKEEGFIKIQDWKRTINGNDANIELWGRTSGKNSVKNKFNFPESLNKSIYGNCCLVGKYEDTLIDLTEDWNKINITEDDMIVDNINDDNISNKKTVDVITKSDHLNIDNNTNINSDSNTSDIDSDIILSDNENNINYELQEDPYIYSSEEECSYNKN